VVDGSGLENRHTRKGIGGSNPSLSARLPSRFHPANVGSGPWPSIWPAGADVRCCWVRVSLVGDEAGWKVWCAPTVRLKVEENQLVDIFGEIGTRLEGLKGA